MSASGNGEFVAIVSRRGDAATLQLRGEIDLASADEFRTAIGTALRCRPTRLEIDFGQITFMDSTGLAVLIDAHRQLGQAHEAIVVLDPSAFVRRLLDLSGISALVDIRTTA